MGTVLTRLPIRAESPGTVSVAVELLGDRRAVVVRMDPTHKRGALSPDDGELLVDAARHARAQRLPMAWFVASSGADIEAGVGAVIGWGRAAAELTRLSGVVPFLVAVTGPAVSGSALLVGLADHVVMTREAYAFVSGPVMVEMMTGVAIDSSTLGGPGAHHRSTGVASLIVDDETEAEAALESILSLLPDHADEAPPVVPTLDHPDRPTPELLEALPRTSTGSYDVRDIARSIADDGEILELRAGWAPNMVTLLTSVGGRPVGIVANQPMSMAGTLDIPASQKGARFVAFCDAFNLPLVTLVDTPGFYPGKDLEWRGMIRHGAQLAFAYARATVPRVCVVLRKSYGGAYIVMDSKAMGNDLCLAWPSAELAVMGAAQAAEILARREDDAGKANFVLDYEDRLLNPYVAAERGFVDEVIDPGETRRHVAAALELLTSKRERLPMRVHDNTPL